MSSPAQRANARRWQQRRRARARHGELVAPVVVGAATLDALIELRWLDEAAAGDRVAIGDAIGRMLADLAKHR